jgi:phenylacetate-CoA ligase
MGFYDNFDEKMYKLQGTKEMKEVQRGKLKERVAWACSVPNPMISMIFQNLNPDSPTLIEDLRKAVPVLDQNMIRGVGGMGGGGGGAPEKGKMVKTMATMQGIDEYDFKLLCGTGGTTGEPTPYFFDHEGIELAYKGVARMMWMLSGESYDNLRRMRVANAFAFSVWVTGTLMTMALIENDVGVIPITAEAGRERLIHFCQRWAPNVLMCTPSYAEHLVDMNPDEVKGLGLERVMCGAEAGAGIPEVRRKMMDGFGCPVTDAMGLVMGMALVSCDSGYEYLGMHSLSDDFMMMELVDAESNEPVPFEDGAIGKMVMVPLIPGLPPIRLSSGDIIQVFTSPCKCGAPGWRMQVVGRADDMLKVRGAMIYPNAVDSVISSFYPRVTGEFRIILTSPPPHVEPPLKLKVEYGKEVKEEELEPLAREIGEKMHNRLSVRPQVQWVSPGSIPSVGGPAMKTKFIEKAYEEKK